VDPQKDTDRPIVEAVLAGDSRRYAELVNRHKDRAMTLALRILRQREDAQEAVQDAFVRAYRSLESFRGESSFSTWFYRILYNLCLTASSRRRTTADADAGEDVELAAEDPSALELLETRELHDALHEEMRNLPSKYAAALTLFYVQDLPYERITEVMGLPMGTVKTLLFRGRALLRSRLAARFQESEVLR